MSWVKVPLSDVADFSNGVNFDKSAYSAGVKLIGVSNFGDRFSPDYDELQEIDTKVVKPGDYLRNGDIVFVRSNGNKELVGRCMLIQNPQYPVTYSGFCIRARIKDTNKYDPMFFAYYFKSKAFRKALAGNAIGANIQNLSQGRLSNHIACVPDVAIQQKIASILSAYDDLIENNQRQIKLLEEAAQRLYKEWFVDLRFPGHETTPITDGIPEGWVASTVGSICDLKKDTVSASKIAADTPYIGLEHMPRVDFCLSNWGTAEDATSNKFRYAENDIIFGKIRPYFHKVGFALNSGVVSTDSFVMVAKQGVWGLLLMTVFDKAFVDYTYQTCKEGAKMPRADWNQMEKYPVLVPSEDVRQKFEDYMWTVTRRIKGLALQNHALAEARDRLLPKLMNGEIEV